MAYFRENEAEETRRQPLKLSGENAPEDSGEYRYTESDYTESDYDDGFDDPEEEEELSEEELKEIRQKRYRVASGAGNLVAVIAGTLVILVLLALLMSMINFVWNDADRNLTLFQNRF